MTAIQVPDGDIGDWLSELKPYQRSTLNVFLASASPEEAAERWLSSTGSPNIAAFGGPHDSKPFWNRFKDEFRKFVCDDSAYIEERESLTAQGPVSKAVMISVVSAAIGATIGYSATLLAPAVALSLCAIGKMGVNAYCSAG
ncbi:MAG: hypothetical protein QM617_14895 [Comamonas sp.]